MATDITSYTEIKGNKSFLVRGAVGTDVAKVFRNLEGITRVLILNNDGTAANLIAVKNSDEAVTTSTGYHVHGGANLNNGVEWFLYPGETLNAVAAADRNVTFVAFPNCNQG